MRPRAARARAWVAALSGLWAAPAGAQICGDAVCNGPGETQCNCPADCPASTTDGCCRVTALTMGDNCMNDPACACTGSAGSCIMAASPPAPPGIFYCSACGNGTCDPGETHCTCPDINFVVVTGDCAAACGDDCCTTGEDANNCPDDCLSFCGNLICEPGEDDCSCADEGCGAPCGDGMCCAAAGETAASCADDCTVCGDGTCTGAETCASCAGDCGCEAGQTCLGDPPICIAPPVCGDEECIV